MIILGLTVARTASQICRPLLLESWKSGLELLPKTGLDLPASFDRWCDYSITGLLRRKASNPEAAQAALRGRAFIFTSISAAPTARGLAYGQGIVVATVLADPTIELGAQDTRDATSGCVQGSGFRLTGLN